MLNRWETLPPTIITSAVSGLGRDELLTYIEDCIKNYSN